MTVEKNCYTLIFLNLKRTGEGRINLHMYTNVLLEYHLHIRTMYINNALFKTDFIVLLKLALCHKSEERNKFPID